MPRVTSNLEKSDGLVHCSLGNAAVLCENHRERIMQFELAHLNKRKKMKKKKKKKKVIWPSGDFLVWHSHDAF